MLYWNIYRCIGIYIVVLGYVLFDKVEFDKGEKPEKNSLPQDNLQQEMTEMRGKNLLKQQLQTGKINSPSESAVLKKSGTVRIVHASIHESPKKNTRIPY